MKNSYIDRELARLERQRLLRDAEHRHRMQKWGQRIHDALWVTIAGLMIVVALFVAGVRMPFA